MSSRKYKWNQAKNYTLYYGYGKVSQLSEFDIAIIESSAYSREECATIQEKGTLLIGYMSVLELPANHPKLWDMAMDDFLQINQMKLTNEAWNTYIMDIRAPRWKEHILDQIDILLDDKKLDGIFLDTIGDLDDPRIPQSLRKLLVRDMISLLYEIRLRYPEHILIQNNGFEHVMQYTVPFIDGICWENPPLQHIDTHPWSKAVLSRLQSFQHELKTKILLLSESNRENYHSKLTQLKQITSQYPYLFYIAPVNYSSEIYSPY